MSLNLKSLAFSTSGYLRVEFERIFGSQPHYRRILVTLAHRGAQNRQALQAACGLKSGGRISEYLDNLEMADLIERYFAVDRPAVCSSGAGATTTARADHNERLGISKAGSRFLSYN